MAVAITRMRSIFSWVSVKNAKLAWGFAGSNVVNPCTLPSTALPISGQ
jgi:hypothetical protein